MVMEELFTSLVSRWIFSSYFYQQMFVWLLREPAIDFQAKYIAVYANTQSVDRNIFLGFFTRVTKPIWKNKQLKLIENTRINLKNSNCYSCDFALLLFVKNVEYLIISKFFFFVARGCKGKCYHGLKWRLRHRGCRRKIIDNSTTESRNWGMRQWTECFDSHSLTRK